MAEFPNSSSAMPGAGYSLSNSMIEYRWRANVGGSVGTGVESTPVDPDAGISAICIRMLGPLTIVRDGATLQLPASRKARALLAYLAVAPNLVGRSALCELLWDGPNDPRGELRWCLSKIRKILDRPDRARVVAFSDLVG